MNTAFPITALLLLASTASAAVGFRFDGSGHWPVAQPPTELGDESAAWKIQLPHWGSSEPVIVGDRIYVIQELDWWDMERVAPSLLCLDLADGSLVWEHELDHTTALPEGQAVQAKADWIRLRKKYHEGWRICSAVAEEHGPGKQALQEARKRLEPVGLDIGKPQTVFNLQITDSDYRQLEKNLKRSHFWTCQWGQPRGQWCGAGYPTPVVAGDRIYVRTGYSAAFCIDLDGQRVWTSLFEGGHGKKQSWCISPVLVDGVLVIADEEACHPFDALGLDAATGAERWRVPPWRSWNGYSIGSCLPLEVDGKHVVHLPSGRVIRPRDGKVLAEGLGRQKWTAATGQGDLLVVPFMGVGGKKGPKEGIYPWLPAEESLVAFRLAWAGSDRLAAERLWERPVGGRNLEISPVLAHGLVFQVTEKPAGITAFDATTGEQVGHRDDRSMGRPRYSWNLAVAGGYLYAVDYQEGRVVVLKADRSLELVAISPPLGRPPAECPPPYATWRIGAGRKPDPRLSQTGALSFVDGHLVLRAWRYLYCFRHR